MATQSRTLQREEEPEWLREAPRAVTPRLIGDAALPAVVRAFYDVEDALERMDVALLDAIHAGGRVDTMARLLAALDGMDAIRRDWQNVNGALWGKSLAIRFTAVDRPCDDAEEIFF